MAKPKSSIRFEPVNPTQADVLLTALVKNRGPFTLTAAEASEKLFGAVRLTPQPDGGVELKFEGR